MVVATGDYRGIVREVIKQGGALLEKQRQIILATARAASGGNLHIGRALVGVHLKGFVPVHLEAADGALVERVLPAGKQVDPLHLVHRALGFRIEGAQAVDLGVQQVDAVGQLAPHRINIEQ